MNKRDLIKNTAEILKDSNVRKKISEEKSRFKIADDDGTERYFYVKRSGRTACYTIDDIENIVGAFLDAIKESVMNGEDVDIHGFGSIYLQKRAEKKTVRPDSGITMVIPERYTPRFSFGTELKLAAKVYEMKMRETGAISKDTLRYYDNNTGAQDGD